MENNVYWRAVFPFDGSSQSLVSDNFSLLKEALRHFIFPRFCMELTPLQFVDKNHIVEYVSSFDKDELVAWIEVCSR